MKPRLAPQPQPQCPQRLMASPRFLGAVSVCLAVIAAGSSASDPGSRPQAPSADGYEQPYYSPSSTEPYTVGRSELRRTVAAPYLPGQKLEYRGRVVHKQGDFRSHEADARMRGASTTSRGFFENVKGSAIGMMFATFAYQHYFRFLSVVEKYDKGSLRKAAIPAFLCLTVLNTACGTLAFFQAKRMKRVLKRIMLFDGLLDMIALSRNGASLLINPITKWRTPGDIYDALIMNATTLALWRILIRIGWF